MKRLRLLVTCALAATLWLAATPLRAAAPEPTIPELTQPVNDFGHVIDPASAAQMERMIRVLQAASGDIVVVATVPTIEPYGDIREYTVKMFENRGRGIGQKGKNNGLLILLAMKERKVWVEVGYDLEEWITDGYAGETSRQYMTPEFRNGRYGAGLAAGTERIIGRIAQGRNVTLEGVRVPSGRVNRGGAAPVWLPFVIFIIILILSRIGGGPGRRGRFMGGMGGWSSGVGPFGGGFGGGGGGFGGGFGGFGGGSSGGGGGGSSW